MPATTSSIGLTETLQEGTDVCVCGIKHHHVHIGALQKKKKKLPPRIRKRPPPSQPTLSQYTHCRAARTTYCTDQCILAALYLTHTNPPAHMWFIRTLFKVPRTGNHYDSVPLTPTHSEMKNCVCVSLTLLLYCSSDPKKTLKFRCWRIQTTSIKGWKKSQSCQLYSMCGPFSIWGFSHIKWHCWI